MSAHPERVAAEACCRVDLAGGTLDIWPLGLLHRGARTVNVAIDLTARIELAAGGGGYAVSQGASRVEAASTEELCLRPEAALIGHVLAALEAPPMEVTVTSGSPRGGGLGASSALVVALIGAVEEWMGSPPSETMERSALARDLEARLMGLPTGRQDHFPALLGGALEIAHEPGGERVRRLTVDLEGLGDCLVIAYTGSSHFSAGNNWQVVRGRLEGDEAVAAAFDEIAAAAAAMSEALEARDYAAVGRLMSREWAARRTLAEGVSTPGIEELLAAAAAAGAWGGKACGAGGGGSIAVLCPAAVRAGVEAALSGLGARLLAASPSARPLRVDRDEAA